MEPAALSTKQLMEYLGVGKNRAYELMHRKDLKAFQIGGLWKVSRKAVDEWIEKQTQGGEE